MIGGDSLKQFQLIQTVGSVVVMIVMVVVWGVPAAPAVILYRCANEAFVSDHQWIDALYTGLSLASAFVVYMVCLLAFSSLLQFIIRVRVKEHSIFPLQSFIAIRWGFCGQIGRCTRPVLQHLVPSFLANIYFRISGATVGPGAQINTANINDPGLITIGKDVVIGGAAVINGHLFERGELIFSPVNIGDNALIGTGVMIQPGVQIGAGAVIASQAVVPKYKVIPAGEVWGGIPARKIKDSSDR